MTMTTQVQKKRQKQSKGLTKKEEDELAKEMGRVLGAEITVKRPSKQLEKALDALALDFAKLQTKVDAVFTIGRKEDYNDRQIGNMIRERMKDHYSAMTIWRVFENYPDARQQQNHEKVNKKLTFSQEKESDHKQSTATNDTKPPEPEVNQTDPNRTFKETIAAKNKIIKQQQEEIEGLRTELATAHKEIAALKKELKAQ